MSECVLLPQTPAVSLDGVQRREFADFLRDVIIEAGARSLAYFRTPIAVANKHGEGGFDPVTQADQEVEAHLRAAILQRYPQHGIYGEEHGFESGTSGWTWVIDPIDGTRSFITGQVNWGVLVALYDGQKPVLGAMYQPFTEELYFSDGLGSVLQHKNIESALRVRGCERLEQSVLLCTTPEMFTSKVELAAFEQLSQKVRMLRYGGDCYCYCMLAHGFVDLIIEADLKAYDVQALIPLIEAAGGVITNWKGHSAAQGGRIVAAGDRRVHAQALQTLAKVTE